MGEGLTLILTILFPYDKTSGGEGHIIFVLYGCHGEQNSHILSCSHLPGRKILSERERWHFLILSTEELVNTLMYRLCSTPSSGRLPHLNSEIPKSRACIVG